MPNSGLFFYDDLKVWHPGVFSHACFVARSGGGTQYEQAFALKCKQGIARFSLAHKTLFADSWRVYDNNNRWCWPSAMACVFFQRTVRPAQYCDIDLVVLECVPCNQAIYGDEMGCVWCLFERYAANGVIDKWKETVTAMMMMMMMLTETFTLSMCSQSYSNIVRRILSAGTNIDVSKCVCQPPGLHSDKSG